MVNWHSIEGSPFPLGASWNEDEKSFNFSLYSKNAETVTLLLFREDLPSHPHQEIEFDYLKNKSGPIWHCRVPDPVDTAYYAYKISGPPPSSDPGYDQHDFDSEKLLLDPYATDIYFPPNFSREAARSPGSNMGRAALAVLRKTSLTQTNKPAVPRPVIHESELIIYEMHVRGFTQHDSSGIPDPERGTFSGVIEKIPYLVDLGITAVELMPVFQFDPDEGNYWGYMPLNFFAPHHKYSVKPDQCEQFTEFREMVDALHSAGIEVILDVVYNHTTEGDHNGPIYSLKGIDSSSYYMLSGDTNAPYANYSGTGNALHTRNRAVRRLIVDSIRHWVAHGNVDGFRFDLASIFCRDSDGSVSTAEPPIFSEISSFASLANTRLIAEPWDAAGLYQLGHRFPGTLWQQWNGAYRDTVQRFIRGDASMAGDLMTRIYGSPDLFPDTRMEACHPFQSINFVTSHDGFTLYDLVSYSQKNNWANGHNNKDGHDDYTWNCGLEGNLGVSAPVMKLRTQQAKNLISILMLSNGTPMFRMGDEFLNSQGGNSNPYAQDNETSWLDWSDLDRNRKFYRFVKLIIRFRKSHPSIGRSRFWREDINWYGPEHTVDLTSESHQLAYCLHGESLNDNDLYVMINAANIDVDFGIWEGCQGDWKQIIDTSKSSPHDICLDSNAPTISTSTYCVRSHSIVVLERERGIQSGYVQKAPE